MSWWWRRRRDLLLGIVLGIVIGLVVVALFVFVFSEQTVDAPSIDKQGTAPAAPTGPLPVQPTPTAP
jgi:hypothetical protein